jgi:membrane protein
MIGKIVAFFMTGIWQTPVEGLPAIKVYGIRCLRIIILAVRNFIRHDSSRTATVLTYYSLLNIVPLFAVIFALAKGFGLKKFVVKQIAEMAQKANWQASITDQLINFAESVLTQAKGGIIAGVGVVLLLWTVISILGKIEDSFNVIWEVKKPRNLMRKFTDYLTVLLVAPLLLTMSSSITIVATSQINVIVQNIKLLGTFSSVIFVLLKLLPYLTMWLLLTALYLIMPNEKVPVRSGIIGAVVAGTIFQVVQLIYIKFQIGVASQSAIYGSFAALPLFLGWLQISWMIMLLGLEVAHANEHYETFGFHPDYTRIGSATKKLLALRIYHLLVRKFAAGEKPLTLPEIARSLKIPVSFVREILSELNMKGLVVEIAKGIRKEASFQPGRSVEEITVKAVLDACERGEDSGMISTYSDEGAEKLSFYIKTLDDAMEKSSGNAKLKDIET